jgi:membrane-bound serine protease (ClpP class)
MRSSASMGAATVVNETGAAMPDKYQSYMRSTIRATAEAHGKDTIVNGTDTIYKWHRDPHIAEAMVDDRTVIPNLIDSGKTLTFTTEEAMKHGYCEGTAENIEAVLTQAGYAAGTYTLQVYEPSTMDSLKGILTNTFLQSILIMLIIGGIYFELQTPGIGFPLAAAVVAAILYFAPLYIDGLAASWEIILFAIGVILIILEIFVIPGFGVAGISGIGLVIFGLTMSMIDNISHYQI